MLLKPNSLLALNFSTRACTQLPRLALSPTSHPSHQLRMSSAGNPVHGIPLEGRRSEIVQGALALFSGSADTNYVKSFWATSAVFEDPITIAEGYDQVISQWIGLAKVFSKSETLSWKVVTNDAKLIEYEQLQKYTFAGVGGTKEMESLVRIELEGAEGSEKVTKLEDRWNEEPINSGAIGKALRNFNGNTVPYFVKDAEKK